MILDDLGTEMATPAAASALYTLINTRLTRSLHTVISTNCSLFPADLFPPVRRVPRAPLLRERHPPDEEKPMSIDLVLHEPEQPGNTGAIGRTCLCAGSGLHLIRPLGFSTDEKSVRRAGLDYWPRLRVREYDGLDAFYRAHPNARIWYLSTKAEKTIAEGDYRDGDFLMLGKESAGLPEELLVRHPDFCVRIIRTSVSAFRWQRASAR